MKYERERLSKAIGVLAGFLLGLLLPLGGLFFKALILGQTDRVWVAQEVTDHFFTYAYMALAGLSVFGALGLYLGDLIDRIHYQAKIIDNLKRFIGEEAVRDGLTELYHDRHLLKEVEKEVERSKRYGRLLSSLMIDVDGFRKINEEHGYLAGDYVLKEVASLLSGNIRRVDTIGRYGADEFLIILPAAKKDDAERVADRLMQRVCDHSFKFEKARLAITLSVGLYACAETKSADGWMLIERAKDALLKAKGFGKNQIYTDKEP